MSLSPISEDSIGELIDAELLRAQQLFPVWQHPYSGFRLNRARRSYGHAHRDGSLVLSRQFIGTSALSDLRDTIRHEFAHLIAGIDKRHGARWKQVASALGAIPRASGRSECDDLHRRMNAAPYTLIAVMSSGEERVLKPAFRRSKRYQDYELGKGGRRYRVGRDWILRFRYEDNHRGA